MHRVTQQAGMANRFNAVITWSSDAKVNPAPGGPQGKRCGQRQ